jgi:hypothetical protein
MVQKTKATKKRRTKVKTLPKRKKALSAKEQQQVQGGTDGSTSTYKLTHQWLIFARDENANTGPNE